MRTEVPSCWQASSAVSTSWRRSVIGRPRTSSALRSRYRTVFLCRCSATAASVRLEPACRNSSTVRRSSAIGSSSSARAPRSEEHTSELQSRQYLVCRLLLEKKKKKKIREYSKKKKKKKTIN